VIQFRNTEIAFAHKTNRALKNAYWLFYSFQHLKLISALSKFAIFLLNIGFPIKFIIKKTLFKQFVGGESIIECRKAVHQLFEKYRVGSILDYSVEGAKNETDFQKTKTEIIKTIQEAVKEEAIPFSVFKLSAFAHSSVLRSSNPSNEYPSEWNNLIEIVTEICSEAKKSSVPILIDAEESWYQNNIDSITEMMMQKFNKEAPIVYTTIQLYRHDKLDYLKTLHQNSLTLDYNLGVKLVRGAYVEKENEFAQKHNKISAVHSQKDSVDHDYNNAVKFCLSNHDFISTIIATHNETSVLLAIELMQKLNFKNNYPRVFFAQLYGMSDHISFNLINAGYNTVKYMPYGPVKDLMPYLLRRAQENTSIKGQSSRELTLIKRELKRRKLA
jgi:proline dehydrogenase